MDFNHSLHIESHVDRLTGALFLREIAEQRGIND